MKVSVSGTIAVAGLRRARRLTLYEVRIEDGSGRLKALWFNQPFLKDTLPRGAQVVLYGTVEPRRLRLAPAHDVVAPIREGRERGRGGRPHRPHRPRVREARPADRQGPAPRAPRPGASRSRTTCPIRCPRTCATRLRRHPARGGAAPHPSAPGGRRPGALLNAARSPAHLRLILEEFFLFQLGHALQRGRPGGSAPSAPPSQVTDRDARGGQAHPALPPDRRPEARAARDRGRHAVAASHEPPGAGRRGLGQDDGRAARDGGRAGERVPGRVHGPHRDPGRAALPDLQAPARALSRTRSPCSRRR